MRRTTGQAESAFDDAPGPITRTGRVPVWTWALPAAAALAVGLDLIADLGEGVEPAHAALELLASSLAGLAGAAGFRRWWSDRRELARSLATARAEGEGWRREAARWREEAEASVRGLSEAIEAELGRWGLSNAEREVAWLLLKGLASKEIAEVRDTSERTAREQAQAVYRKAGLSGRSELAAYFLEDLLSPPVASRTAPDPSATTPPTAAQPGPKSAPTPGSPTSRATSTGTP